MRREAGGFSDKGSTFINLYKPLYILLRRIKLAVMLISLRASGWSSIFRPQPIPLLKFHSIWDAGGTVKVRLMINSLQDSLMWNSNPQINS